MRGPHQLRAGARTGVGGSGCVVGWSDHSPGKRARSGRWPARGYRTVAAPLVCSAGHRWSGSACRSVAPVIIPKVTWWIRAGRSRYFRTDHGQSDRLTSPSCEHASQLLGSSWIPGTTS